MTIPTTWPDQIRDYINKNLGVAPTLELLNGKSGANVYRLRSADASLILKTSLHSNEVPFYQNIAPVLIANHIPIPALKIAFKDASGSWLILEDIPNPLPPEYRTGHIDLITILARLHTLKLESIPAQFNGYIPSWTSELTDKALACFTPPVAQQIHPRLETLQQKAQPLFQREALISADPNPGNWGVRADGSLVLFDWERFTRATPAIDLAIILAGLGNMRHFTEIATNYRVEREKLNQPYLLPVQQLAQRIAHAKLWTLVEYLSEYTDGHLQPDALLERLTQQTPGWLNALKLEE